MGDNQLTLNLGEIALRLVAATFFSGLIGYDREQRNHPAGIRTHIMVCVGACVIALIQQEISVQALTIARDLPKYAGVVRADPARLIAQVVSGIGFLGAGTIVITRHSVTGLTTAASLWATAAIGLALGMGYYRIAILGVITVLIVLVVLKKVLRIHTLQRIEVKYYQRTATSQFILNYFKKHQVEVEYSSFHADRQKDQTVYTNIYTVDLPTHLSYSEVMAQLTENENIIQIRLITP